MTGIRSMAIAVAVTLNFVASAQSQEWPAKPVRIVTGGAGNFNDIVARYLAVQLSARWKQPVFV